MVPQRLNGLSDREAVDAFDFDLRWKYPAGTLDFDYPGFVHTVLVDMRERLRRSKRPNRIFEAVLAVAKEAGWSVASACSTGSSGGTEARRVGGGSGAIPRHSAWTALRASRGWPVPHRASGGA
jgi:hypothetical protein